MKAQGFLAENGVDTQETVDAKAKLGESDALRMAREAKVVIAAKGAKITRFDMKKDAPSDDELLVVMLGPTGNLRAPTVRKGGTLLIGFSEAAYRELFAR
ncbi:MAG: hypothetical protein KDA32_02025 [Phycisphaerales bacterium]|nr:hypothetical protein [Phycisphaerales bacterium]